MIEFDQKSLDFLRTANVSITLANPALTDCPLTYVNPKFLEVTGYDEMEVLGNNCRFLQCSETLKSDTAKIKIAIKEPRPITISLRNQKANGEKFWNLLFLTNIKLDGNQFIMGCQYEIPRNHASEEVKKHSSQLANTIESANLRASYSWSTIRTSMHIQANSVFQILQSRNDLNKLIE